MNEREQNRLMCSVYDNTRRPLIYVTFVDNEVMRFVTAPSFYEVPTCMGELLV